MPIYMKYGDVKGDVTAEGHKDWIEVNSFQFGVGRGISSPTGGSGDREASAPSVSEIVVTKPTDLSSAKLFDNALHGEGVLVKIDFCKTDKGQLETYLQYTLTNTMISGMSSSTGGGERPTESLSLSFTKVAFKDVAMGAKGEDGSPETVTYDLGLAKIV